MVNRLTRIYTKTGDDGTTALSNNSRTAKFMPRINAIGSVDEANSAIGLVVSLVDVKPNIQRIISQIQNDLFDLGAEIAGSKTVKITEEQIKFLENNIDEINKWLEPLESFILPRGIYGAGLLHLARSIVRRAERDVWYWFSTDMDGHANEEFSQLPMTYLNRLSDLLFVMARFCGHKNETLWKVKYEE